MASSSARLLLMGEEMAIGKVTSGTKEVVRDCCFSNPQLHPPVPYLMPPRSDEEQAMGLLNLYCLICEQDALLKGLPQQLRWKYCLNSCGNWLMVFDEISNPHMINPFTGAHLPLPPISTFDEVSPLYDGRDPEIPCGPIARYYFNYLYPLPVHTVDGAGRVYFKKAVIGFFSPTDYTDYIVMAIHKGHRRDLAFARAGDEAWTSMDLRESFLDIMYLRGRFYGLNREGQLTAYDFSHRRRWPKSTVISNTLFPSKKMKIRYLACSSDGSQIFQIVKEEAGDQYYDVGKLSSDGRWQLTLDMGGLSFFLGDNQAISVMTRDIPGATKDCACFTDVYKHFQVEHCSQIPDSDTFKLRFGNFSSHYRKKYLSVWPRPVWYMCSTSLEAERHSEAEKEKGKEILLDVEKPSEAEEEKGKEERQLEVPSTGRKREPMKTREEGTPEKKRAKKTGQ